MVHAGAERFEGRPETDDARKLKVHRNNRPGSWRTMLHVDCAPRRNILVNGIQFLCAD